jgi:hypothetical protein
MRLLIAALTLMSFSVPALAEDSKKIDIMNPYKEQQQKVVERSTATNKQYKDDWYEHVEKRYGGKIERPADDAYVTSVPPAKTDKPDSAADTGK